MRWLFVSLFVVLLLHGVDAGANWVVPVVLIALMALLIAE